MNALELIDVRIVRGGRTLLDGVNARFASGTFTAIVGANGVGKTSLLETLCGTARPQRGRVLFDGTDLARRTPRERARAIAFVEGTDAFSNAITVAEVVAGGRFPHHRWWQWHATPDDLDAIDHALAATDLTSLRERTVGTLSAGERQRVWLAVALAQRAPVLALDEPTSHLDLRFAVDVLARLRALARGGAIVIAAIHALEEVAAFADRVLLLAEGGVRADGDPAATLTTAHLRAAFGVDVRVERNGTGLSFFREPTDPAGSAAGPAGSTSKN